MIRIDPLSLEAILARCEKVGDCMEWTGRMRDGRPNLWHTEKRHWISTRRRVYDLTRAKPLAGRYQVVATCQNEACIAPGHIKAMLKVSWLKAAMDKTRHSPRYRAANTAGNRRRATTKLTMEVARAIRESPLSSRKEAQARGISASLVRAIRRNEVWREGVVPGASVFSLWKEAA